MPVSPHPTIRLGARAFDVRTRALVMGILNRTPDSFYDRGDTWGLDALLRRAERHVADGADLLDVGGVKAGPGPDVSEEEELDRVVPVVEALHSRFDVPLSADTWRSGVLDAVCSAGAVLGNDISGFADPDYLTVAAGHGASVVATHIRLKPRVPDPDPQYADLVPDVVAFLIDRAGRAGEAGIATDQTVLDAGLDLGKTPAQSAVLLRESGALASLGYPLLLSASNKRFVGELLGRSVEDRRAESLAAACHGVMNGCRIVARARCRRHRPRLPDRRGHPRAGARGGDRRGRPTVSAEDRPQTHLVKADDPILRDREVERLVSDLLEGEDRLLALEDQTVPGRGRAGGDESTAGEVDEVVEAPVMRAVFTALQSPPFMTTRRIVVVRDIGNVASQYAGALAEHVKDPVGGVYLVLVSGGGKTPAAIDKAVKAAGVPTVGPASESTADVLAAALRGAKLKLTGPTSARVVEHLGGDAGRVPELVELLHSTYGDRAALDLDDVEPYLGEVGTVAWWDLANSIDRGDVPGALEVLHRLLRATSAKQPKVVHPLQVMATLASHYQKLLRLDDPAIANEGAGRRRRRWEPRGRPPPAGCVAAPRDVGAARGLRPTGRRRPRSAWEDRRAGGDGAGGVGRPAGRAQQAACPGRSLAALGGGCGLGGPLHDA